MEELLFERLLYIACNPKVAFTTLWTRLDQLGARIEGISGASASTQHRLTKEDLKTLLNEAGVILAPSMDVAEVRTVFAGTSAVGRQWIRDIAELRIVNPVSRGLARSDFTKETNNIAHRASRFWQDLCIVGLTRKTRSAITSLQ